MKPEPASALFAGPFALATLSAPDGPEFPALVTPDGRAVDLRDVFGDDRHHPSTCWTAGRRPCLGCARWPPTPAWPARPSRSCACTRPRLRARCSSRARTTGNTSSTCTSPTAPPGDDRPESERRAEAAEIMDRRAAEDLPYVFIGLPTSIGGPYDDVVLPAWAEQPDWELELAVVIGRPAHRVPVTEAPEYIAGYTIANDLTDRAAVFRRDMPRIGTDWLRSKNAPGFHPARPVDRPGRVDPNPDDLRVTLKLNGETMQDESTQDMIFEVARMVSYASQTARLLPGDLVLTGSPAGNGMHWGRLLRDGDVMEGTVTGLGVQRTLLCRGGLMNRLDPEGAIAEAAEAYSNWGRWGADDRIGTPQLP